MIKKRRGDIALKDKVRQKIAAVLITALLAGQSSPVLPAWAASDGGGSGDIVLADHNGAAPIILDAGSEVLDGLKLNAEAFANDINLVTGQTPSIHLVSVSGGETQNNTAGNSGTPINYALTSAGAVVTEAGIHEDGIKKKSAVNDGKLAYGEGYWRGLNNGTAELTITLGKTVTVSEIDIIGRTEDGTAAEKQLSPSGQTAALPYLTRMQTAASRPYRRWISLVRGLRKPHGRRGTRLRW